MEVGDVGPVGHETAGLRHFAPFAKSRQAVLHCQRSQALSVVEEDWIGNNEKAGRAFGDGRKRRLVISGVTNFEHVEFDAQVPGCFSRRLHLADTAGMVHLSQHGNAGLPAQAFP